MNRRPALSGLGLSTGKQVRLYRILHRHGLGNGIAMFLPYDRGLEHGPRDFFANPAAADPAYIVRLAVRVASTVLRSRWATPRSSTRRRRRGAAHS